MKSALMKALVRLGIVVTLIHLSGCAFIGYRIGNTIDKGTRQVPEQQWRDIRLGCRVLVYTARDSLIAGAYDGSHYMSPSEYNERLSNWMSRDTKTKSVPSSGTAVVLSLASSEEVKGELAGYDRRQELAAGAGARTEEVGIVVLKRASTGRYARFDINLLKAVSVDSTVSISSDRLRELIITEKIPTLSTIVVKTESQQHSIPLDDVIKIHYSQRGASRWIGMGMGLAVDAAIVAIVIFMAQGGIDWGD
jgi:hypothetical protein